MNHQSPVTAAPPVDRLTPVQALDLAIELATSLQAVIQQADGKVAMLLVVHPGTSLLVLSQVGRLSAGRHADLASFVVGVMAIAFVTGFVMAGWHIFLALRPRAVPTLRANRFAFPSIEDPGVQALLDADLEELAAEAWAHDQILAGIAGVKNRHVLGAVRWLVPMIAAAAVGLAVWQV